MASRGAAGLPQDDRYWYMVSAARRLDFAHTQLERAREAIAAYIADPATALKALADVEFAFVAMHRAIEMAASVNGRFQTPARFPAVVQDKRAAVEALRDAYEHIDARALGFIDGRVEDRAAAHSLFVESGYGKALIDRREVTYGDLRFGIDGEATDLLIAVRGFLHDAWAHMCDEEVARAPEAAGAP
jgi:hypothetical protein